MTLYVAIVYFVLIAAVVAQPPYRYPQPGPVPQHPIPQHPQQQQQPIRQSIPIGNYRPQSQVSGSSQQAHGGIFSVVQSPPLPQFSGGQQQQQQSFSAPLQGPQSGPGPAPQHIAVPVAIQQQQQFVAPQQQFLGQQQVPNFVTPQPSVQPIPSIPQSHQQQVVQQQVVQSFQQPQPQPQSGYAQAGFQSFQRPQTAIITKDIYIHSAPEDQEESALGQQLDNAPIRKNYRIVFIKAPTPNLRLAAAALKHAHTSNEEKTVIYVLSKKSDLGEVQQQLQQAQGEQKSHKPEVYFIKYKTQEEAQRAQQEIQAQYDALGGSTQISDEGIAPITSVIGNSGGALNLSGPIGGGDLQQSFSHTGFAGTPTAPSQKYLPAKVL